MVSCEIVKTPEVTIVIPSFNRSELLRRSLASALGQTFTDIEVVVCDDGSTDNTSQVLAGFADRRLRVVRQPTNRGMFVNMNAGVNAARGRYFLMLSDDDYLEPDCVAALIEPWHRHDGLGMVYGQWWYHTPQGPVLQVGDGPDLENGWDYVAGYWAGQRPTILHGALFRTDLVRAVGGIGAGVAQDSLLQLRMAFEGKVAHVRQPVTHYVLQPGSATHRIDLSTLVNDRRLLLEKCLQYGRERGVPDAELRTLKRQTYHKLAFKAALGIISQVGQGASRSAALHHSLRLRSLLRYNLLMGLAAVGSVLCLPRFGINLARRLRHKLTA